MAKWDPPLTPLNASPAALDWALKHVEEFGDTVFLPRAFEYEAIRSNWTDVRVWLESQGLREWKARPFRRFLARKSAYSFRFVTQLDPLEYLLFTALVYEVGPQLEALRSPRSEKTVFSWRFDLKPDGQMYSPASRWDDFNTRCLILAGKAGCKWVVVADIADFFPHIYIHPVETALESATDRSPAAYCLLRMISNWNAFVSYGLPVGLAGSRIIAE
ncbi:MAG: reverse transcriptase, partial [Acidobacteriota bacterium]|nr:reverse transcriptase [Acidobacteriota bacterium]